MQNSPPTPIRRKLTLADWVGLVRLLEGRRWEDGGIEGVLRVNSGSVVELLRQVFANEGDTPCRVLEGDPDALRVGATYRLILDLPRLGLGYVLKDAAVWLRHESARCGRMDRWYIVDLDWMAGEPNDTLGSAYEAMVKFIRLLEECAAVADEAKALLVFLPGERLDVPIRYDDATLRNLDVKGIDEIVALAKIEDGHAKQRRDILATAVCDMVRDVPRDDRFKFVVSQAQELCRRFRDGYSMFASAFSFEKVRDQMEALRVDYTGRIHKVLSDIQGQLLGIPISTIVLATQMKDVPAPGAALWGNVAVLVGAVVFVILLFLSIRNQWHTLDVLAVEIDRQENVTRRDHADIAERFEKTFAGLRRRLVHQRWVLGIVAFLAGGGLLLAFTMFWALTQPALNYFFG